MKTLVFATANKGKLAEAKEIFAGQYNVISAAEAGFLDDVEETGSTFQENSLLKAEALWKATGMDCFADDSGLEVDALGGAPGIYSARYASLAGEGTDHDFNDNIDRLLHELEKHPGEPRTARFRCVVTLMLDGKPHFFDGTFEGSIAFQRAGCGGFGYDPVFVPDMFPDKTVSELGEDVKNSVSHRAVALGKMARFLGDQASSQI